jgi:hypothetical protein
VAQSQGAKSKDMPAGCRMNNVYGETSPNAAIQKHSGWPFYTKESKMKQNAAAQNMTSARHLQVKSLARIMVAFVAIFSVWIFAGANFTPAQAATLSAPSLSCYTKTYNSVTLKWSEVRGAQSYIVYKYSAADGRFIRVKVVPGATTVKYTVTGLTKGTTYQFMIRPAKTVTGSYVGYKSNVLTVKTYQPKTYRITPATLPTNPTMMRYGYYNSYTRQYYMVRSYMEWFEKCGGGKLIFSPGTYTITNTIFVPSNVAIVFEDGVTVNKGTYTGCNLAPSNSLFQLIRPSKGHSIGVYGGYNGEKNIVFQGLGNAVIDMKYQAKSNCIQTGHNQNLTVSGITFRNVNGGHFIEMDATKNAIVQDCNFSNITGDTIREAINLDTPDKVTGGFTANWSTYDCTANYNVLITRCTFSSMGRAVGTHNYSGNHTHDYVTITDNTLNNMYSYGIGMMNWRYAVVSNNTINGSSKAIAENRSGILGYGVYGSTIKDNTISTYKWGMLFKIGQGTSAAEIAAYGKIYNYFSRENLGDLSTNYCRTSVADKRALIYNADGSITKIILPTL